MMFLEISSVAVLLRVNIFATNMQNYTGLRSVNRPDFSRAISHELTCNKTHVLIELTFFVLGTQIIEETLLDVGFIN